MRLNKSLSITLFILLSGCSFFTTSGRQVYVENRCEHDTAASTRGLNHCQDAASINAYHQDYETYQREYEELSNSPSPNRL